MSTSSPAATPLSVDSEQPQLSRVWHSVVPQLPLQPGVYWFLDSSENVLYVGKAKSLKKRVTSYTQEKRLSARIKHMVETAVTLRFRPLTNELSAILTEAELIKTYQPPYNVLLKDDKSPIYVVITDEDFPQVKQVRLQSVSHLGSKSKAVFGPFQSAYQLKQVLRIVRKIFPWCNDQNKLGNKPCFYYHLGLCPGVCTKKVSQQEYLLAIDKLILFLKGKSKQVVNDLKSAMKESSDAQEYEKAGLYRDTIQNIERVVDPAYRLAPTLTNLTQSDDKDGPTYLSRILRTSIGIPREYALKKIECYDVSNTQGTNAAVSLVTAINGATTPSEYKIFNIRSLNTPNDYYMLQEAITRRQNHPEWGIPDLIVIDGGKGQLRAVLTVWQWHTPVISIAKDPDRLIIPKIPWHSWGKTDLKKLEYLELKLPDNHPGLQLVQRLRDEAHRFSKKQHTKLRTKHMLAESTKPFNS